MVALKARNKRDKLTDARTPKVETSFNFSPRYISLKLHESIVLDLI